MFPIEYLVAPDEGHGFQRPVNNMAMYAAIEKFLYKHVGTRYQESVPRDVSARLKEITVDPATVKLTKPVDASSVTMPTPSQPLEMAPATYAVTIALGGQTMKLESTNTVTDAGGMLTVTEAMKTPQGDASDVTTVDRATLAVRTREIKQGPMTVTLAFEGGKATGTAAMGGPAQPVAVDMGGPLFADGPAAFRSVAALPLKDGYTVTFRNFDVMKRKSGLKQAKVIGSEDVTVSAGTFKAWKVEIKNADGAPGDQTIWVDARSRRIVKVSAVLPEMGGAIVTMELQK
jgi:hypothetical protein